MVWICLFMLWGSWKEREERPEYRLLIETSLFLTTPGASGWTRYHRLYPTVAASVWRLINITDNFCKTVSVMITIRTKQHNYNKSVGKYEGSKNISLSLSITCLLSHVPRHHVLGRVSRDHVHFSIQHRAQTCSDYIISVFRKQINTTDYLSNLLFISWFIILSKYVVNS